MVDKRSYAFVKWSGNDVIHGIVLRNFSLAAKSRMLKGAFLFVTAMTMFVALMGGSTPRIGMLMPVLSSTLLSLHVMLVSYLNSVSESVKAGSPSESE